MCNFIFEPLDSKIFVDNFNVNQEWPVIKINNIRSIEKSYCNKLPYNQPKNNYDVAIYSKSRWYYLDFKTCEGSVIKFSNSISIPNLKIIKKSFKPLVSCIIFDFDLQIMLTLINKRDNYAILESKIQDDKCKLIIDEMIIECKPSLFRYKGEHHKKFKQIIEILKEEYKHFETQMISIYDELNLKPLYKHHESIAPKTWYKAKRQNQQQWPSINTEGKGLEFPKNSKVYYSDPNIGLAFRIDDNPETFIPKLYKTNHFNNPETILYKYIHNIKIEQISVPTNIKVNKNIQIEDEFSIEIDFNNKILSIPKIQKYISYENMYVSQPKETYEFPENVKVQILDKNNQREYIINHENKIILSKGYRLKNIITFPWYYKQIIHDYNKLGRLKYGDYMDLTHIGIVDPKGSDIITFPFISELFIGECLETHRLMTFKHQPNVIIKIL